MLPAIIELSSNLAFLVALSLISGFIRQKWEQGLWGQMLQGMLFGAAAVLGMMRPLVIGPGLLFDGRSVMISLCGLFFGPVAAAISAVMAGAYRVAQGGAGMRMGVLVILASALLGLAFRARFRTGSKAPSPWTLLGLGLAVHAVMVLLMFTLPSGVALPTFKRLALPVILVYPVVTVVIGQILAGHLVRMREHEDLAHTQAILSEFVRHSPIHVYIKEVEPGRSRVLQASENFQDMIGIPGRDMVGKTMEELFPPEFARRITEDDWKVAASGKVLKLDEELNGRSYSTIKFPIHQGGRVLLAGYTIDITERKQSLQALAEKEVRLRTLVRSIPDLVWLKDANGMYLFCNPMFERFFGAKESEIIGKTDYDFVDKELADFFRANDLRAMAAGHPVSNEETVTFADDGHQALLQATKTPMYADDGTFIGVLGIGHDITELRRMEEERRQLEAQLQHSQKMESIGSLAGGVAHDMNNVLGAIMVMASTHQENHPEGSPTHRAFDTILKASERGGKMVRSLLGFSRRSLAEERILDLNEILREEVSLLERTTLSRIRLTLDLAPELHAMRGDGNALNNALMNLCVNAVDAMPEGGSLTLRTRNLDRDWIEVLVEDSGHGMPKEVLEKAMDPFFTTKAQGKGTGLGLSLVYGTVKAHKGEMEIHSEEGRGTQVRLRFPSAQRAEEAAEVGGTGAPEGTVSTQRILLVDDDPLVLGSLQASLVALGHQVTPAASGEEALRILDTETWFDVVILDFNMPGLGGAGTLPRLRALRPTLPVLLATGRADQTAMDLLAAHSGVTLLAKPFGLKELRAHLEGLWANRGYN